MRDIFEKALQANPDDLAGWCAYADYLVEQDDPRGEFMQTQIALEDESLSKDERDVLKKKERALLKKHRTEWLGELAPLVLEDATPSRPANVAAGFTRGWLTELSFKRLSVNEARALARTPEAKMLSRLFIEDTADEVSGEGPGGDDETVYEPGPDVPADIDEYDSPSLYALTWVPHLAGIRVFRLGNGNGEMAHELIKRMPRLEELHLYAHRVFAEIIFAYPIPQLRVLHYDHASYYPLEVLATNPTLGNLTSISCHPHAQRPGDSDAYIRLDQLRAICRSPHLRKLSHLQLLLTDFGDAGIEEIITSGMLKQIRELNLSYGCVTDAGAALLAECPDLKNLTQLDLSQNALGDAGIKALQSTGVSVNTTAQHGEHPKRMGERGWLEYLSYGDME